MMPIAYSTDNDGLLKKSLSSGKYAPKRYRELSVLLITPDS